MGPRPTARSPSASATIPWLWRFLLLNVEPLCTIGGFLMLTFAPTVYTSSMTRHTLTTIDPASEFIYTQLVGGWLHFAFIEGVVLRFVDDYRVWRLSCLGMLVSDAFFLHSCAQAIGGWGVWLQVGLRGCHGHADTLVPSSGWKDARSEIRTRVISPRPPSGPR